MFMHKFTKQVYFIAYQEPIRLVQLINNLFPHVRLSPIEYQLHRIENTYFEIYVYVEENRIKFCLGKEGRYIQSVNELLSTLLDKRIKIYLRVLAF